MPETLLFTIVIDRTPDCDPGDVAAADAYLRLIRRALAEGELTALERKRLRRLQGVWKLRSLGADFRFNLVGTRSGRLSFRDEVRLHALDS